MPVGPIKKYDCPELGIGWQVFVYPRKGARGSSNTSSTYKMYVAPDGSKHKSLVQARIYLDGPSCTKCGSGEDGPGNEIVLCDGKGCNKAYHQACLEEPLASVPEGDWLCPACEQKKLLGGFAPGGAGRKRSSATGDGGGGGKRGGGSRGGGGGFRSWIDESCGAPPIESYYAPGEYRGSGSHYSMNLYGSNASVLTAGPSRTWADLPNEPIAEANGPAIYYVYNGDVPPARHVEGRGGSSSWSARGTEPALPPVPNDPAARHQQQMVTATAIAAAKAAAAMDDSEEVRQLQSFVRPSCPHETCVGGSGEACTSEAEHGYLRCSKCGHTWQSAWWFKFLSAAAAPPPAAADPAAPSDAIKDAPHPWISAFEASERAGGADEEGGEGGPSPARKSPKKSPKKAARSKALALAAAEEEEEEEGGAGLADSYTTQHGSEGGPLGPKPPQKKPKLSLAKGGKGNGPAASADGQKGTTKGAGSSGGVGASSTQKASPQKPAKSSPQKASKGAGSSSALAAAPYSTGGAAGAAATAAAEKARLEREREKEMELERLRKERAKARAAAKGEDESVEEAASAALASAAAASAAAAKAKEAQARAAHAQAVARAATAKAAAAAKAAAKEVSVTAKVAASKALASSSKAGNGKAGGGQAGGTPKGGTSVGTPKQKPAAAAKGGGKVSSVGKVSSGGKGGGESVGPAAKPAAKPVKRPRDVASLDDYNNQPAKPRR